MTYPDDMAGRPLSYLATLPTDVLKGIGPKNAKKLSKAGIDSVADVLLHVPRRYLDRSQQFDLMAVPLGEEVTVTGIVTRVRKVRLRGKGNRMMIDASVVNSDSVLHVRWSPHDYGRAEAGPA